MRITQVDAQYRKEYGMQGRHTTSAYFLVVEMIEPTRRRQSYVAHLLLHPTGIFNLQSREPVLTPGMHRCKYPVGVKQHLCELFAYKCFAYSTVSSP